ncbi:unannotated protein [freshwater metagenome]|uniref:Unannotated protein n=1 Tax=freshwater metagenome TaxID=449393 RepID=A0A6J7L9K2_9ZZZZ
MLELLNSVNNAAIARTTQALDVSKCTGLAGEVPGLNPLVFELGDGSW